MVYRSCGSPPYVVGPTWPRTNKRGRGSLELCVSSCCHGRLLRSLLESTVVHITDKNHFVRLRTINVCVPQLKCLLKIHKMFKFEM